MSFRCINAFEFAGKIYPGGSQIADDHPILATHAPYFAKVQENFPGTETATAAPNEVRIPQQPSAEDTESWLAAEKRYEDDVQAWLLAEEEHQSAALAAVTAAAAQNDADDAKKADNDPAARRAAARRPRGQEGKN